MKRLAAVAAVAFFVACGGGTEQSDSDPGEGWIPIEGGDFLYREVEIPDGRTIPCIYDASAMSCDWSER